MPTPFQTTPWDFIPPILHFAYINYFILLSTTIPHPNLHPPTYSINTDESLVWLREKSSNGTFNSIATIMPYCPGFLAYRQTPIQRRYNSIPMQAQYQRPLPTSKHMNSMNLPLITYSIFPDESLFSV